MKYDIIIIGAGASGLAAAYQASRQMPQRNVLVLEKESVPGRKLSASGNGKCNVTNSSFGADCYHSSEQVKLEEWIHNKSHQEVVSFLEEMGVLLYEKNGYYYPFSNQAKQVTNILYEKSKMAGVSFLFDTTVTDIQRTHNVKDYEITAISKMGKMIHCNAKYVILATGGLATPKLGGGREGYNLAKKLGLHCETLYPVLSPIYVEDTFLSIAKGVRLDGEVTLKIDGREPVKEAGQIQFNDNNLSGIVMMNLSCYWNFHRGQCAAKLYIDVLPLYSWENLKTFFEEQRNRFPKENITDLLKGILPSGFVSYLMKRLKLDTNVSAKDMTDKQINRLTSYLKKLEFIPVYTEDFDKAQVTGGGIPLREVNLKTFESTKCTNLYITGEILDVNGKCGGYNLTFAILSGLQAIQDVQGKESK